MASPGNEAVTSPVPLTVMEALMRLLLLIAVIALGTDALLYSGAYSQAAWQAASVQVDHLLNQAQAKIGEAGRKT